MGLRLGIDLDGVVADFTSGWIDRYNQQFGTSLHRDQATMWSAPVEMGAFSSMGEFWRWASGLEGGFFRQLDPYPDALGTITALHDAGHRIVIITSKPSWAHEQTHRWIAAHELPTREVHITRDKASVACDVYLDDYNRNLLKLVAERPRATVCRYVRPWNDPIPRVRDVHGCAAFTDIVHRLGPPPDH